MIVDMPLNQTKPNQDVFTQNICSIVQGMVLQYLMKYIKMLSNVQQ